MSLTITELQDFNVSAQPKTMFTWGPTLSMAGDPPSAADSTSFLARLSGLITAGTAGAVNIINARNQQQQPQQQQYPGIVGVPMTQSAKLMIIGAIGLGALLLIVLLGKR